MRTRLLNPGFFLNEDLAALGPHAMILFEGMWCAADREGRLPDRPGRLKAMILPYFDCNVDALLTALADKGFVVRYEIEGEKYLEIPKFLTHQTPHKRESASAIPARVVQPRSGLSRAKAKPKPHLDSAPIETETGSETKTETLTPEQESFERFWPLYPRKDGKQTAREKWADMTPEQREAAIHDVPLRLAANWADRPLDKFPHAATYLNQRRWEDELQTHLPVVRAGPHLSPGMANLARIVTEERAKKREAMASNETTRLERSRSSED